MSQLVILALAVAFSIGMASVLPDRVPIHWGINGQPDGWGSKWLNLLMMPAIIALMIGLTVLLPRISPKGYRITAFSETFGYVMLLMTGMFGLLHVVIGLASAGVQVPMLAVTFGLIFALLALMGNVMGRIKPNMYMGIRTRWTLADPRVWAETHRSAGRLWVVGGLIGLVASVLSINPVLLIAGMMVMCFWPVGQSYFIYRRLGN